MAFRKSFKGKKKYGKKRTYTKKWARKKMTRKNSNRVLSKFRVAHDITTVSSIAEGCISLSNLLYSHNKTLASNSEFGNFITLYDSVRPCGIKIKWIPESNSAIVATSGASYSSMYTAVDYNDTLFDTGTTKTKAEILEYNNMKFKNGLRPQKWYFKLKKQPQNFSRSVESANLSINYPIKPQSKLGYFSADGFQGYSGTPATDLTRGTIWPNAAFFYYHFPTDQITDDQVVGTFLVTYYYAFLQRR